jgi:hypothetical protein
MNKRRLEKLKEMTAKDTGAYELSFDENGEVQIYSFKVNRFLNKFFSKKSYADHFSMIDSKGEIFQYSINELTLYLKGYDLLNKKTTEYIPKKKRAKKKTPYVYTNNCTCKCEKCNLNYPKREMRGNICYLCAEG